MIRTSILTLRYSIAIRVPWNKFYRRPSSRDNVGRSRNILAPACLPFCSTRLHWCCKLSEFPTPVRFYRQLCKSMCVRSECPCLLAGSGGPLTQLCLPFNQCLYICMAFILTCLNHLLESVLAHFVFVSYKKEKSIVYSRRL